MQSRRCHMGHQ